VLSLGPSRSAGAPGGAAERHLEAVAGSLKFASEAAGRGDHRDALGWLNVLEALGEELPADYIADRTAWLAATTVGQVTSPTTEHDEAG
jgi:hypothetical protein